MKTNSRPVELPERFAVLLSSKQRGKQLVAGCCALAESKRVHVGMTLAHARSLLCGHCAEIREFRPDEDSQALNRLALWSLRFTPVVAVDQPDGLLMDIAGCEHLYGGEVPLVQRIAHALDRLGLQHRIAVGPTYSAAHAVARFANERIICFHEDVLQDMLARLPIDALQIESAVCDSLNAVGVEQVEQLLALPREVLASRYGSALLRRIDQTMGTATELIQPVREPEPFTVSYVFDGPVLNLAAIEVTARELLQSLTRKLKKTGLGIVCLALRLFRIDTPPETMTWTFAHPTHDSQHVWSLVHTRLERVHLGFGVEVIALQATRTATVQVMQNTLWSDDGIGVNDVALGKLLDQLIDHLGPQAVTHPVLCESHMPEVAFKLSHFDETSCAKSQTSFAIDPAIRPSRLFDPLQMAQVIALVPHGPPAQIVWRGRTLAVLSCVGPERILFPWWAIRPFENQAVQEVRDYFAVQDEHGRWLWLFRRASTGQWFVHGEWA